MKILALTHGDDVGPGVFEDAASAAGHELAERNVARDGVPAEPADALIVLGGAMHPDQDDRHGWLGPEFRYLAEQLERGTPVLGVCLGSQLLARAAGASVYPADEPEVGWVTVELTGAAAADPVASSLPPEFEAFQWHSYTHGLPDGAVELARSRVCTQAWRLGNAWGVQFHPEVRAGQVESWLAQEPDDVPDPAAFVAATRERIADWNELGRRLCTAFLGAA